MKQPVLLLILFAAGLGVGFGLQILVGGDSDGAETAATSTSEPGSPGGTDPEPEVRTGGGEPSEENPVSEDDEVALEVEADPELVALLDAVPTVEVGPTDGAITGRVLSDDGEPLAGVEVVARVQSVPGVKTVSARRAELTDYVKQRVKSYRYRTATTSRSVTNEEGEFVCGGLADTTYRLEARLEGWDIDREDPRRWQYRPGDRVDFIATQRLSFPVTVLDPEGRRASKAKLICRGAGREDECAWTPEKSEIELLPGSYEIIATSGDELTSAPRFVELWGDRRPQNVTFDLIPRTGFRGTVTAAEAEAIQDCRVRWMRLNPGHDVDVERLAQSTQELRLDPGGTFKALDLAPGAYAIGVSRLKGRIDAHIIAQVGHGLTEISLALPALSRDEVLAVWATGPDGDPLASVDISARYRSGNSSNTAHTRMYSRPDGSRWILLADEFWRHVGSDARGKAFLEISTPGFGSKRVQVTSSEVQVQFRRPAYLECTVLGYATSDLQGAIAITLRSTEEEAPRNYGFSSYWGETGNLDANGTISIGPQEEGEYEIALAVRSVGRNNGYQIVDRFPVRLVAGTNRQALSLPQLYELTVEFPEIDGETRITLQRSGRDRALHYSDELEEPGSVTFRRVPVGKYQIQVFGPGMVGIMSVEVEASQSITFEASPINAMRVRVHSDDGAYARAGFEDGDLIVAVDGQEFTDFTQMQQLFLMLMQSEDTSTRVTLLRHGAERDLDVDPREVFQNDGAGGSLDPATRD